MLRTARARAGLELRKAARWARVSHTHLLRIEAGIRSPSTAVVDGAAEALCLVLCPATLPRQSLRSGRRRSRLLSENQTIPMTNAVNSPCSNPDDLKGCFQGVHAGSLFHTARVLHDPLARKHAAVSIPVRRN